MSIVHHEAWLDWTRACQAADRANILSLKEAREATRSISVSQRFSGAYLNLLPVSPAARIRTDTRTYGHCSGASGST